MSSKFRCLLFPGSVWTFSAW